MKTASQQIGPHRFCFEEPDIFFITFDGDLRAEHIFLMYDAAEVIVRERNLPRVLLLEDFSRLQAVAPSVREAMSKDPRAAMIGAVAGFGASFTVRVLINAVEKAIRFFRGKSGPAVFFATEAEARVWLAEQREPNAH